jgi:energy-coupling factor transport system ATP-binding protein
MMKIKISNLSYSYPNDVVALKDISLEIMAGEQVVIVGQNGAGKTTLVKQLNGLLKPTVGVVNIGDWTTETSTIAKLSSRVGYVFQNPDEQLFCNTVLKEVSFGPKNLNFDPERSEELVNQALNLTGLYEQRNTNPYDLSLTLRKMVAVASIIAMDTPVVILDEPTTGQDAVNIGRIVAITEYLRKNGKTVIAITHDIDFGVENFERVIVMSQGTILLDGSVPDVVKEVDTLAKTYVDPPQITRLAMELGIQETICNIDDFLLVFRQKGSDQG